MPRQAPVFDYDASEADPYSEVGFVSGDSDSPRAVEKISRVGLETFL